MMKWEIEKNKDGSARMADTYLQGGEFKKGPLNRGFGISVHGYVGLKGWFVTARDVQLQAVQLEATDLEEAKREGLMKVYERIAELLQSLTDIGVQIVKEIDKLDEASHV